jgi:hypothetical protein
VTIAVGKGYADDAQSFICWLPLANIEDMMNRGLHVRKVMIGVDNSTSSTCTCTLNHLVLVPQTIPCVNRKLSAACVI